MKSIVLDQIAYHPNVHDLCQRLHVKAGSTDEAALRRMVEEAELLARPKFVAKMMDVSFIDSETVKMADETFHSRVLRVNLEDSQHAVAFVATCGMELQAWGEAHADYVENYWAEAIKEDALASAVAGGMKVITDWFDHSHFSTMSPGSLENWPISEQTALFAALGEPQKSVGVTLTDSMLMIPSKSISGIAFTTSGDFESCAMCSRVNCPGRRAPYDETLFEREYCPAM